MNTFKKVSGIIAYIISFGFLLICILGVLIIIDKLLTILPRGSALGAEPILNHHFMAFMLPTESGGCGPGGFCPGPIWLITPKKFYAISSVVTGLVSFGFYKLGKKWRRDNEVISEN